MHAIGQHDRFALDFGEVELRYIDDKSMGKAYLVASGDYPGFAVAVSQTLARRAALRGTCNEFAQNFAWPVFGSGVWAALQGRVE